VRFVGATPILLMVSSFSNKFLFISQAAKRSTQMVSDRNASERGILALHTTGTNVVQAIKITPGLSPGAVDGLHDCLSNNI